MKIKSFLVFFILASPSLLLASLSTSDQENQHKRVFNTSVGDLLIDAKKNEISLEIGKKRVGGCGSLFYGLPGAKGGGRALSVHTNMTDAEILDAIQKANLTPIADKGGEEDTGENSEKGGEEDVTRRM